MLVSKIQSGVADALQRGLDKNSEIRALLDKLKPLLEKDESSPIDEPSQETKEVVIELNRRFNKVYDTDFYYL